MKRNAYLLIFDGLADWEPAHALCHIHQYGKLDVVPVGFSTRPVVTMGGLRLTPEVAIEQIEPAEVAIFILPGGEMWETESHPKLSSLLQRLHAENAPIAAICAATLQIARAGLTRQLRHTSNSIAYLKSMVADYTDDAFYVDTLALTDRNIITASGLGSLEFAREVILLLKLHDEPNTQLWFDMFKTGEIPEAFRPGESASRSGAEPR